MVELVGVQFFIGILFKPLFQKILIVEKKPTAYLQIFGILNYLI